MAEALQLTAEADGAPAVEAPVFLCHNNLDKPFIREIADALELEFGRRFFLDVFAIPVGEKFIPWIEKALGECSACAIFLGANGWGPTHLWEAELALARYRRDPTMRIIPVALPGINQGESAKLGSGKLFQEVNWADFTKGPRDRESLDKFEAALTGRQALGYRGPARLTPYQVRRDAERWEKSHRKDTSILYGGGQLTQAETMARDNPDAIVLPDVAGFLAASRERQSAFWRRTAIVSSLVVLLLAGAATAAFTLYLLAEQRRLGSVSRQLAAAVRDAPGPDRAMLIAARAVLVQDTPEARSALIEQLQHLRFLRRIAYAGTYVGAAAAAQDGRFLLGTEAGPALLGTGDLAPRFENPKPARSVTSILEAAGSTVMGREDGSVEVVTEGRSRVLVPAPQNVPPGRERRVRALAFEPSRRMLALGTGSGRIAIVQLSDGRVLYDGDENSGTRINSLSFDPTRSRLAAGTSAAILLLDTATMRKGLRYPGVGGGVLALAYTNSGSLAAVGSEGRFYYFDGRNPELESPIMGDIVPMATSAAIDPILSRVAVGDASGVIRLYDAATGRQTGVEPLQGHSDSVMAIAFGRNKDDLISGSSNGTVAIWDLAGGQGPEEQLPQLNPAPSILRAAVDGSLVAVTNDDDHAVVWKFKDREWRSPFDLTDETNEAGDQTSFFPEAKPDAEGFTDVAARVGATVLSDDGEVVAWSTSGGAVLTASTVQRSVPPIVVVKSGGSPPRELAISGNGQSLALLNEAGTRISVYTVGASGDPQAITPPSASRSIALSRDGTLLTAGTEDGTLIQYAKAPSWKRKGEPWSVHLSQVAGVTYSADARFIVSFGSGGGGADRSVAISNVSGRPDVRHLESRQADGSVSAVSVGSDGDIAFGGNDGQVLLWSLPSARYSGQLTSGTAYTSSVLVDDERRRILTASGDGSVRSWTLEPARWVALACAKANRDWRPEEWRELLPDDAYVASCASQRPQSGKRDARRSR